MSWWLWLVSGFALLVFELFLPTGFYMFIFGLAAILMGLVGLCGLDLSSDTQLLWYAIISVALVLGMRKHLAAKLFAGTKNISDELTGQEAIVTEAIAAHGIGNCELRGSSWKAKNLSPHPLHAGERALVKGVDGLTLSLEKRS